MRKELGLLDADDDCGDAEDDGGGDADDEGGDADDDGGDADDDEGDAYDNVDAYGYDLNDYSEPTGCAEVRTEATVVALAVPSPVVPSEPQVLEVVSDQNLYSL